VDASHPRTAIGDVVDGRYELVRVLGVGGMATVYEAVHQYTLRHVALKLLHPHVLASSPVAGSRVLREARAAASIRHPGVAEVLDVGALPDGRVFVVFELLDGEDLDRYLARGPVSPAELADIMVAVLEILAAAHARGFVHRDVKPSNIFLCRDREGRRVVKLLDFGVVKVRQPGVELTGRGLLVGTLEYMSPEQASAAEIDARADLWSVGATMLTALTGLPPFHARSPRELVMRIFHDPVPSLGARRDDVSRELVEVVDRSLRRDPAERWPDARAMAAALRRVPELETGWLRRWRRVAVAAAVLVVCGALSVIYLSPGTV
jgi:serine/threonine protein kinase